MDDIPPGLFGIESMRVPLLFAWKHAVYEIITVH